jgi:two-component system chemotaxis response regulator CheY
MKILIVDDYATMRRIVRNSLNQLGFQNIKEAIDGQAALTALEAGEFSLIISDWNMPNMCGIDLLRAVRGDPRFNTIPFLMVTAECHNDNLEEAALAGVSNYIIKPFTRDVLRQKLEAIFDGREDLIKLF